MEIIPAASAVRFLPAFERQVVDVYLAAHELGLRPDLSEGYVLVSRDAMASANPVPTAKLGDTDCIPEMWAYPRTLDVLRYVFPGLRLVWAGKTDDHLLLDVQRPVTGEPIARGTRVEMANGELRLRSG